MVAVLLRVGCIGGPGGLVVSVVDCGLTACRFESASHRKITSLTFPQCSMNTKSKALVLCPAVSVRLGI